MAPRDRLPSLALSLLLTCLGGASAFAERLPLQNFTMRDGLPSDSVNCLVRDRDGFLWICTTEGLAVYDGFRFRAFGEAEGLPHRNVNVVLQASDGTYWIGTDDGLVWFPPSTRAAGQPRFSVVRPPAPTHWVPDKVVANRILSLLEDRSGRIWCGTAQAGLFTVDRSGHRLSMSLVLPDLPIDTQINALAEGENGTIWVGTTRGLQRRQPDGTTEWFGRLDSLSPGPPGSSREISSLFSNDGRLFVGTRSGGLHLIDQAAQPGRSNVLQSWHLPDARGGDSVYGLIATADGHLWYGGPGGAREVTVEPGTHAAPRRWGARDGLGSSDVRALAEDPSGDVWIGTDGSGLFRLRRGGFTTFTVDDGLAGDMIRDLFLVGDTVHAVTANARGWFINRFENDRFQAADEPYHTDSYGLAWNQLVAHDRFGLWWLTRWPDKVVRYRASSLEELKTATASYFGAQQGLWSDAVFKVYEDSNGDVWLGTWDGLQNVARWIRSSGRIERHSVRTYPYEAGKGFGFVPEFFAEAPQGVLWIGSALGGMARYRHNRWDYFEERDGVPSGRIRTLLRDRRGRLWVGATTGGLARIDSPDAERPVFIPVRKTDGLSSDRILALTEDLNGFVYAGTGIGVDRLDPDTLEVRRYGVEDGLPGGRIVTALRDAHGDLWFGSTKGLTRFNPAAFKDAGWPELRVLRITAPGFTPSLSDLGEREVPAFALQPHQDAVQITVGALASGPMPGLRFEGRLEGSGAEWVPVEPGRPTLLLNLQPGEYRFVARATASGRVGPSTVAVSFTILRPWWQRPWALALEAVAVLAVAVLAYNLRVRHLLAIERVRSRIASDLHDDVGAGLSRVALLSDAARGHQGPDRDRVAQGALSEVASTARRLASQMADIVWATDPRHDTVGNVIGRASWFATELLALRGTEWRCTVDESAAVRRLGPEAKRHLLLLLQEAINNVAKHAGARQVSLEARVVDGALSITMVDDGCGFDVAALRHHDHGGAANGSNGGHGLTNMTTRARALGATCAIASSPGHGCRITVRIP
jgi:ligand-binding sensor domain-containing protein/signal transduction histidine kinase